MAPGCRSPARRRRCSRRFTPLCGRLLGRHPRHRLRRLLDRPQQHRHGAGPRQHDRGEGLRLPAAEADRRHAGAPRHSLRPPASFKPFGDDYRGGVSLATGWLAGPLGGAKRIVVGQLADGARVKVYSSGSALDGGPAMYLHSPVAPRPRHRVPRDRELRHRSRERPACRSRRPARRPAPTCW